MIEPRNYNYTCSTMVNHQKRFIVDDVEILINDIETVYGWYDVDVPNTMMSIRLMMVHGG